MRIHPEARGHQQNMGSQNLRSSAGQKLNAAKYLEPHADKKAHETIRSAPTKPTDSCSTVVAGRGVRCPDLGDETSLCPKHRWQNSLQFVSFGALALVQYVFAAS